MDGRLRLLSKIARMYHERGIRQADIAASLNISQAKVSRLLKRAADEGIVRTMVMPPPGVHTGLEEALEETFGLLEAVVVDSDEGADEREVVSALGAGTASHLEATLSGGDRIGIASWSQTLLAVADHLRPFTVRGADEVVQLLGGGGVPRVQSQAQRLLTSLARSLGAQAVPVQAPGIVAAPEVRDALLADDALGEVTARWRRLTMALVGIGGVQPSDALAESGNAFSGQDRERLLAAGAVGDICHHVFATDGSVVTGELAARIVSIPVDDFLAIPRRLGVAGGPRKVKPILGALRGGWVNVLVTDPSTARAVLGLDAEELGGSASGMVDHVP